MAGIDLPAVLTLDRGDKVPAWTPEDERAFTERLASNLRTNDANLQPLDVELVRRPKPPTAVTFAVDLAIDRKARATCPECRKRRVLYAIVVGGNAFGGSEPRCARDWGIR